MFLKMPVRKSDVTGFSEAELSGHLINKNNPENTSKKSTVNPGDLIHEDYQLYAALTVLEGMALANR